MTFQLAFYMDLNRCINCKTCEMACNEYYGLTDVHRRNVVSFEAESSLKAIHLSMSCNHCRNPVCITVCPENNYQKRSDGVVIHTANHCQTCMRCITACPFHAPKLNPVTNSVDKCNFCVERLDQGVKPVCVENCITGALNIVKINHTTKTSQTTEGGDLLVADYTEPSISIAKKQNGQIFLRKGCNSYE